MVGSLCYKLMVGMAWAGAGAGAVAADRFGLYQTMIVIVCVSVITSIVGRLVEK